MGTGITTSIEEGKMTIDEAIERLTSLEGHPVLRSWLDTRDAINLGIEALKGFQDCRRYPKRPITKLLPGETKND